MSTTTIHQNRKSGERGMTLFAVMAVMTVALVALMAVAPSVYQEIQREKELESIRRGEEVAEAIRQYVQFYGGNRLPNSMDDLLEGLPQGTKRRQILRASAAIDPLSEDGRWRLIKADPTSLGPFAKRVQAYNGGVLPPNPGSYLDRYSVVVVSALNTEVEGEVETEDESIEVLTDNTPFIGVASQSKAPSIISYYGIGNHSRWVFTPMFRGTTGAQIRPGIRPNGPPRNTGGIR